LCSPVIDLQHIAVILRLRLVAIPKPLTNPSLVVPLWRQQLSLVVHLGLQRLLLAQLDQLLERLALQMPMDCQLDLRR
jgi:hypothetical protein